MNSTITDCSCGTAHGACSACGKTGCIVLLQAGPLCRACYARATEATGPRCSECDRRARARGLCWRHYGQAKRGGRLQTLPRPSDRDLVLRHTSRVGECLIWTGRTANGFPIWHRSDHRRVNPAWALLGDKPPGKVDLLRACGNPLCIAPAHLTIRERVRS